MVKAIFIAMAMVIVFDKFVVGDGACGYGDLVKEGYGVNNVALSTALFNNGLTCGACYEIECNSKKDPKWCHHGSIIYNPPREHFDLSMPAILKIGEYRASIIPLNYRRISGFKYWTHVLVYNVGGAGDVREVSIKGPRAGSWETMQTNWGQIWQTGNDYSGQSLSFRVTTSGRSVESIDAAPTIWQH
ncbi:hypothetical protein AMTRI_Chr08g163280 [Amborella trichopoda]